MLYFVYKNGYGGIFVKRSHFLILLVFFIFCQAVFTTPTAFANSKVKQNKVTTKTMILGLKDGTDLDEFIEANDIDQDQVKKLENLGIVIATLDEGQIDDLNDNDHIEFIEEDQELRLKQKEKVDKKHKDLKKLKEGKQMLPSLFKESENEEEVKLSSTGRDIKIAILDTGVSNHTDLHVAGGESFIESNRDFEDDNGHGTYLAGIIAGLNNESGIVGIAPKSEIYGVKVLDEKGRGTYSQVIQGIDWSIKNRMNIISIGFSGQHESDALYRAIQKAAEEDILLVAPGYLSDGEGRSSYPSAFQDVISVGVIEENEDLLPRGSDIDIYLPETATISTGKDNNYGVMSGPSIASAQLTGIASLLWSEEKDKSAKEIKETIEEFTISVEKDNEEYRILDLKKLQESLYKQQPGNTSIVSTTNIVVNKGETYRFTNTGTWYSALNNNASTTEKRFFDYVIYSSTGKESEIGFDSTKTPYLSDGGSIVVTVLSDNPVTFSLNENFTSEVHANPALTRKTLQAGESLQYTNNDTQTLTIVSNANTTKRYDYTLYRDKNGTAASSLAYSWDELLVSPGERAVITNVSDYPITFAGTYDRFNVENSPNPALFKATLDKGESFTFSLTKGNYVDIKPSSNANFDYAEYFEDWASSGLSMDHGLGSATIFEKHMVITLLSDKTVTFGGPYEMISGERSSDPALLKTTLSNGESFSFVNSSTHESSVVTNGSTSYNRLFNYTVYTREGTVYSEGTNSSRTKQTVPAGGKMVVTTVSDNPVTFGASYKIFNLPSDGGGNEHQFETLDVNAYTDINKNNSATALFKLTPAHSGKHRIFTSPYLDNGLEQDTRLYIYSDADLQNEITSNDDHVGPFGTKFSKVEWDALANSTYYVKLETTAVALQSRLTFEEDLDSTRETAIPAEWDQIYTDKLTSPYDVDYFVLTAEEMAYMNLYVTNNILILEDSHGTELQTFHAGEENTLFVTETAGTYYAKVVWNKDQAQSKSGISIFSNDIGGSYQAGFHGPKRISSNFAVDTTPGFEKSVTVQWRFSSPHPNVTIQVLKKGTVVYEEIRTNQSAGYHTFSWNGIYTKVNPGQWAETGVYYVRVIASDASNYKISLPISVVNTIPNEEFDIQYLISYYNNTISSDTIRQAQENLKEMLFYDGPITGTYNEEFLMSVIAFEVILNRSVHVSLNVNTGGGEVLEEKGELTNQLVHYIKSGRATGKDKYGIFAEFLFTGDIVIFETGEVMVPAFRLTKIGGKLVKKAGKKLDDLCNCFTAGTKVLTDEGEKSIEEIEVGDKVLAKDDETGEMAYKEVEWIFRRDVEETYNITVGSEVITTTDEHPFWIVGKGWVESKNLVVGDVLTTSYGKELAIEKIKVKQEHKTVYNFKVKDFHTYFVSNLRIWTHNSCGWFADVSKRKNWTHVGGKDSWLKEKGFTEGRQYRTDILKTDVTDANGKKIGEIHYLQKDLSDPTKYTPPHFQYIDPKTGKTLGEHYYFDVD